MRGFLLRNPSFGLLLGSTPGLLAVEAGQPAAGLFIELALCLVLALVGARRHALALAALACVLVPRTCAARELRLTEVALWRSQPQGTLQVRGRAEAIGAANSRRATLLFRVRTVASPGGPALARTGWIRLVWQEPGDIPGTGPPPVGRDVQVEGRFRPARAPENPGTLDWGALAGGPRVRGSLSVRTWGLTGTGGAPLLEGLRERLSARVASLFPPLSGGFMAAALFGDRESLDPRLREVFSRTGTGHIVAISGMNVALLAVIGWAVLTPFVAGARRRRAVLAGALLLYVPLGGNAPSVVRAALMAVGLLGAQAAARRVLLPNALGTAGLLVLTLQPGALLDPSFQLSFAAVLGLSALPGLPGTGLRRKHDGGFRKRILAGALDLGAVTLASLAATLALTLGYFRHFPVVALPANLVVVPALGALTAGGFAALLASFVSAPLGRLYARACDLLLLLVFRALETFARPSWAWVALPGPRAALAAGGLCVTALTFAAIRSRRWRFHAAALALLAAAAFLGAARARSRGQLEVAVLSVGQGDAIALLLPDGAALLVDGGPPDAGGTVTAFLHERGVGRLRRVFATHPDADHVGGLRRVLEEVPADSVHDPAQWGAGSPYRRYLEGSWAARAGYRPLAAGERLQEGEVSLEVLWPPPGLAGRDPYWQGFATNDASLVLLVRYRQLRVLLTGDIGGEVEAALARAYGRSLRSPFLKAAHHGSRFSSTAEFVGEVGADVVLISVGRDNPHGHPHPEALARLAPGAEIWRTDREGALLLRSDGRTWELRGWSSGRSERGRLGLSAAGSAR